MWQQAHAYSFLLLCPNNLPNMTGASGLPNAARNAASWFRTNGIVTKPVLPQKWHPGAVWVLLCSRIRGDDSYQSIRITCVTPVYTGDHYFTFPPLFISFQLIKFIFFYARLLRAIFQKCSCSATSFSRSLCNVTSTKGLKLLNETS